MVSRFGLCLTAYVILTACSSGGGRLETVAPAAASDWRKVATANDRERLRTWRQAWTAALSKARASGNGSAIVAEGALFEPDRALDAAMPPPGSYRCRVFKLGAQGASMRDLVAYPFFECRVDEAGDLLRFQKVGGSQRPVGVIYPDGGARAVFLGTLMLGDESNAIVYGRDAGRDMAGIVQRIGERRWRIVLPYPRYESTLDVIELVPA